MLRFSLSMTAAALGLVSCRPSQPVSYAQTEGVRIGGQPPLILPARVASVAQPKAARGRIAFRTAVGSEPRAISVAMALGPGDRSIVQQTTDAKGLATVENLTPGEYLVTARHLGLQPQAVRLRVTPGFVDTVVFNLGQP